MRDDPKAFFQGNVSERLQDLGLGNIATHRRYDSQWKRPRWLHVDKDVAYKRATGREKDAFQVFWREENSILMPSILDLRFSRLESPRA